MSYTLIEQFSKQRVHIKFNGYFQGKTVIWNTYFYTLAGYSNHKNIENTSLKQFIDINPSKLPEMNLTVALNIKEINPPNINKMMIMINQYKNLSIGRHEYGS